MTGLAKAAVRPNDKILKSVAAKVAGAILVAFLTCTAAANTFGLIAQAGRPDQALRFSPNNANALTRRAIQLLTHAKNPEIVVTIRDMALHALRVEPITPSAFFLLGSIAEGRGKTADADSLMQMAAKLSRRDIASQLWLIERAISLNRADGALFHYDVALRSNRVISGTLFPILLQAISEPEIRRGLKPYFANATPWIPAFLDYAVTSRANDASVAQLLIEVGGNRDPKIYEPVYHSLINQLIADGKLEAARDLYLSLPGSDRSILQSTNFERANTDSRYAPLTWDLSSNEAGNVFYSPTGTQGVAAIVIQLGPDQTTRFARKVSFLSPGQYRMEIVRLSKTNGGRALTLLPVVYCFEAANGRVSVNSNNVASKEQDSEAVVFEVTQYCPAQYLFLRATSMANQDFDEAVVSEVTLVRNPH